MDRVSATGSLHPLAGPLPLLLISPLSMGSVSQKDKTSMGWVSYPLYLKGYTPWHEKHTVLFGSEETN